MSLVARNGDSSARTVWSLGVSPCPVSLSGVLLDSSPPRYGRLRLTASAEMCHGVFFEPFSVPHLNLETYDIPTLESLRMFHLLLYIVSYIP